MALNTNGSDNMRLRGERSAWPWAILGILLLGLIIFTVAAMRNAANFGTGGGTDVPGEINPAAIDEPLTNPALIFEAQNPSAFDGVNIEFDNVTVDRVAGDYGFWIMAAGAQPLFVHVDDSLRDDLRDDDIAIQSGQRLYIRGELNEPPTATNMRNDWQLGSQDAQDIENAGIYAHADSIERR